MKIPAVTNLGERLVDLVLAKIPEKRTSKSATPQFYIKKIAYVFILPLIFLLGGSLCIIVFATVALNKPIPIPLSKFAPYRRIAFTSEPPGKVVLGKSIVRKESRPLILKKYLEAHHSPLADHADYLIEAANKYDLDWRLLPAIAGQESTFCRTIPEDSYNCWGWGVHSRGTLKFNTWKEAIETVAKGLRENYLDQGYQTPEKIMEIYCPRSVTEANGSWATGVKYFIWELENF